MLKPTLRAVDFRTVKPIPKEIEPFYSSAPWLALRDRVRREAQGRCQRPGCNRRGFIVDHIVEIRDGGAKLERGNVWLMCSSCHATKTGRERAARMRA